MIKIIIVILLILILAECINFTIGIVIMPIKPKGFEKEHESLIEWLGLIYWILKLITYPFLIPYKKNKKKREKIKEYQDELIRKIDNYDYRCNYRSITKIQNKIEELKKSLNQDLYSRASDSYSDMLHILIKCSDGEGNIDINEFESIIKEALTECTEIVNVAHKEHEDRLQKLNNNIITIKKRKLNKI